MKMSRFKQFMCVYLFAVCFCLFVLNLSVRVSVSLFICLSIYLSVFPFCVYWRIPTFGQGAGKVRQGIARCSNNLAETPNTQYRYPIQNYL